MSSTGEIPVKQGGMRCPTCFRRLPHAKKPSSPKSKVESFRIPEDVKTDYTELMEAAIEHSGLGGKPFAKFHVLNAGLVLVLQGKAGFLTRDDGTN